MSVPGHTHLGGQRYSTIIGNTCRGEPSEV